MPRYPRSTNRCTSDRSGRPVDLLTGEDLEKTGAGNLFTVFGEPDSEVRDPADGRVEVKLSGVDVYDPTIGEVRTDDTGRSRSGWSTPTMTATAPSCATATSPAAASWWLQTALKAEIDAEAWLSLHGTTSRPFPRPSSGRIAVKVINAYCDEIMEVFDVD